MPRPLFRTPSRQLPPRRRPCPTRRPRPRPPRASWLPRTRPSSASPALRRRSTTPSAYDAAVAGVADARSSSMPPTKPSSMRTSRSSRPRLSLPTTRHSRPILRLSTTRPLLPRARRATISWSSLTLPTLAIRRRRCRRWLKAALSDADAKLSDANDAYAAALAELGDAKDALAAAQAEYDKYHPS